LRFTGFESREREDSAQQEFLPLSPYIAMPLSLSNSLKFNFMNKSLPGRCSGRTEQQHEIKSGTAVILHNCIYTRHGSFHHPLQPSLAHPADAADGIAGINIASACSQALYKVGTVTLKCGMSTENGNTRHTCTVQLPKKLDTENSPLVLLALCL
jgi:hypothetical protein